MVCLTGTWPRWWTTILLVVLLGGCAQSAKESPAPFTDTSIPSGYNFPHPKNVADPTVHGAWVLQSGTSLCVNCHKSDANPTLPGPKCDSCHAAYPHSSGWVAKEAHGKDVIDNGAMSCQSQCHGADLAGGLSKVSCTTCHSIYPHATGWKDPQTHGASATGDGKKTCQLCHGTDYLGGQSKVACASSNCHNAPYPHADGWVAKEVHGKYVIDNGQAGCQTKCHGTDLTGGLSSVSCTKCHSTYPHVAGWKEPQVHGAAALGDGKTICKLCHGDTYAGGQSKVACSNCHLPYPHAEGWLAAGASTHGPVVNVEGSTQCQSCHGNNDSGSIFSSFCNDCHKQHLSSPTTCKSCHEAGKGLTAARPADGIHPATQDCVTCHDYATGDFKILRGETIDFTQSGHADPDGALSGHGSISCARCHNVSGNKDYTGADGTAPDIINSGVSFTTPGPLDCTSCHNAVTASYVSPGVTIKTTSGKGLLVGREGFCVRCHQARTGEGSLKVSAAIAGQADDTVMAGTYTYAQWPGNTAAGGTVSGNTNRNAAISTHYFPAANIFYGSDAGVGYEYAGKTYVGKNTLMVGYDTCIACHNPHTTAVKVAGCTTCHIAVSTAADLLNVRVTSSDYDGDGNTSEGVSFEVDGVKAKLLQAIQNYALNVPPAATGIQYASGSWSKLGGGTYAQWTPRLLKAAFNYQLVDRDTAAYAHNSKYVIELLYDAIADLNTGMDATGHAANKVDVAGMTRP